jgi:hypothetical protein
LADRRKAFGDHAARHAQLQILEVLDRADRLLGVNDVGAVVNAPDIHDVLLGEDLAGHLEPVLAVEEHVPLVRIAQSHQVGRQERARRHLAYPVHGEGIHRLEHTVLHAVEQFEVSDDFLGGEGLELKLAAGLFLDRCRPGLEGAQSDAGGPGGLHLPGRRFGRFGIANIGGADNRGSRNRGSAEYGATRMRCVGTQFHGFLPVVCFLSVWNGHYPPSTPEQADLCRGRWS